MKQPARWDGAAPEIDALVQPWLPARPRVILVLPSGDRSHAGAEMPGVRLSEPCNSVNEIGMRPPREALADGGQQTMDAAKNLERALQYIAAVEQGATGEALAAFFAPDVVQQEFPNRIAPNGQTRGLAELLDGAEKGQKVLSSQRYRVHRQVASGNHVALEIEWTGTLAVPLGTLPIGSELRAHLGVFLDFENGRIKAQRNYDCYEPW
jgi:ketosteroid isomerase-like protein